MYLFADTTTDPDSIAGTKEGEGEAASKSQAPYGASVVQVNKRCLYCYKEVCMSSVPKLIEVKPNHFVAFR